MVKIVSRYIRFQNQSLVLILYQKAELLCASEYLTLTTSQKKVPVNLFDHAGTHGVLVMEGAIQDL
jgi:hypothetical protein